jgi:hypothetical protein
VNLRDGAHELGRPRLLRERDKRRVTSREGPTMRWISILSVLIVSLSADDAARAQQTNDCKLCREYQQACLKNHTREACNNEYDICMKYCRKK